MVSQELLKSSQHGSRDEAERKRKQEDEVNELKLALRLKDEELLMLTDLGGGRGKGKVPGHHSDEEVENAILHEKMEELRQEFFYSLAVGIKLNLSMQVCFSHITSHHACTRQLTFVPPSLKRAFNAPRASRPCTTTP
jgi:hypothetical protein